MGKLYEIPIQISYIYIKTLNKLFEIFFFTTLQNKYKKNMHIGIYKE